jgi:hypothetical protein
MRVTSKLSRRPFARMSLWGLLASPAGYSPFMLRGGILVPKAEPHFDAEGIVQAVQAQDVGLRITTNNPTRFKQLIYKAAAKLGQRVHIYVYPRRPNALALLKEARPQLQESSDVPAG